MIRVPCETLDRAKKQKVRLKTLILTAQADEVANFLDRTVGGACVRPFTMVCAPDNARPLAIAKPMPAVDARTTAALPERSIFISRLH